MKKIFKSALMAIIFIAIFCSCIGNNAIAQSDATKPLTYQTFYDDLSPYGTWIDYPNYGHVWNPHINGDFRPYATNGHWVYSSAGWAWASGYSWGWAAFHYGSWVYDDNYGWLWIPGYDWSPAWVTWGNVDNYYCWAPLMPGIQLSVEFGSWRPHSFYWNACNRDHIYDRNLSAYLESRERFAGAVNRIAIINNFTTTNTHNSYYSKGPDVQEVQHYVNHKINETAIRDVNRISRTNHNGNVMNVYRPSIEDPKETSSQNLHPALQPKEFRRIETTQSNPISREEQKPMIENREQRNNIQRLPVIRSENNYSRGETRRGRG